MKKRLKIMILILVCCSASPVFANLFVDTAVLGRILSETIQQNEKLNQSIGLARQGVILFKDLFAKIGRVFGGIELPHDFALDQGVLDETDFHDPKMAKISELIKNAGDLVDRFRNTSLDQILHGGTLEDITGMIGDVWNIDFKIPDKQQNTRDAFRTVTAFGSLDAGGRAFPLLSSMQASMENILPEINRASPGRAMQISAHLNFLQSAGMQHLLENQAATTQMAAVETLDRQTKEKESRKATNDIYSALSAVVDKELQNK